MQNRFGILLYIHNRIIKCNDWFALMIERPFF